MKIFITYIFWNLLAKRPWVIDIFQCDILSTSYRWTPIRSVTIRAHAREWCNYTRSPSFVALRRAKPSRELCVAHPPPNSLSPPSHIWKTTPISLVPCARRRTPPSTPRLPPPCPPPLWRNSCAVKQHDCCGNFAAIKWLPSEDTPTVVSDWSDVFPPPSQAWRATAGKSDLCSVPFPQPLSRAIAPRHSLAASRSTRLCRPPIHDDDFSYFPRDLLWENFITAGHTGVSVATREPQESPGHNTFYTAHFWINEILLVTFSLFL